MGFFSSLAERIAPILSFRCSESGTEYNTDSDVKNQQDTPVPTVQSKGSLEASVPSDNQCSRYIQACGNELIQRCLALLQSRAKGRQFWNNIIIPAGTHTAECDILVLGFKTLCIIECKNYKGYVTGYPARDMWQVETTGGKYKFYNPLKQNEAHCVALRELFDYQVPMVSIVVFGSDTRLPAPLLNYRTPYSCICTEGNLNECLRYLSGKITTVLPISVHQHISSVLGKYAATSDIRRFEHIRNVQKYLKRVGNNRRL